ncbi:hypothetical protein RA263_28365, partial [Pseudomonas syringae pv. tagetis]|uniref:hypothetical protein n=1 Tax=Pseudomonas syringae group genomosp. 7 TaxID=251699 RepID=UPI00376F6B90
LFLSIYLEGRLSFGGGEYECELILVVLIWLLMCYNGVLFFVYVRNAYSFLGADMIVLVLEFFCVI